MCTHRYTQTHPRTCALLSPSPRAACAPWPSVRPSAPGPARTRPPLRAALHPEAAPWPPAWPFACECENPRSLMQWVSGKAACEAGLSRGLACRAAPGAWAQRPFLHLTWQTDWGARSLHRAALFVRNQRSLSSNLAKPVGSQEAMLGSSVCLVRPRTAPSATLDQTPRAAPEHAHAEHITYVWHCPTLLCADMQNRLPCTRRLLETIKSVAGTNCAWHWTPPHRVSSHLTQYSRSMRACVACSCSNSCRAPLRADSSAARPLCAVSEVPVAATTCSRYHPETHVICVTCAVQRVTVHMTCVSQQIMWHAWHALPHTRPCVRVGSFPFRDARLIP